MTPRLSQAQRALLATIATETDGAMDATPETKTTAAKLIKRGCLIVIPRQDAPNRLVITEAGRALVGAPDDPDGVATAPDAAQGAPGGPSVETPPPEVVVPAGKLARLTALLRRPEGATVDDLMTATGWQAHSVRGALSGALKRKQGLVIVSEKTETGRVYRIASGAAA